MSCQARREDQKQLVLCEIDTDPMPIDGAAVSWTALAKQPAKFRKVVPEVILTDWP